MINKVILVGRIGQDAIGKTTQIGHSVANFSVATSESYKDDKGEWQNKSEWHNIVLWKREGIVPYLKKGTLIYFQQKSLTD